MPLFRSSKNKEKGAALPPPQRLNVADQAVTKRVPDPILTSHNRLRSRSNSIKSNKSSVSISSSLIDSHSPPLSPSESRVNLKSMFKKSLSATSLNSIDTRETPDLELKKRVSTITETLEDEYDDDSEDSGDNSGDNVSDASDASDDSYEMHTHAIKMRARSFSALSTSQLSTIMGYCGMGSLVSNTEQLREAANEESKRTFSIIEGDIKRLDNKDHYASIIGNEQIELINDLKRKLLKILDLKSKSQLDCISKHPTLAGKYGVVKEIIGKGSYGIIKIIDPGRGKKIYAVKELSKRTTGEANNLFIERVLSEFIISSNLNHKNIVKTVDFMMTLPTTVSENIKFSQVMDCTPGGDLFTYVTSNHSTDRMCLDEVDCLVKQIAKGVNYMHNHGVAHCDLKLENILISYAGECTARRGGIVLKITDFGKSNVFRTKFDSKEQLYEDGRLGSEPYMCPEEYTSKPYSLTKKDSWALGVIILVLFNIRKHYYSGVALDEETEEYPSGYLWQTTEAKFNNKFKDKVFSEYSKTRMLSEYDPASKEWLVKRSGAFKPLEQMFMNPVAPSESGSDDGSQDEGDELDDLCELRRWIIYKLLDVTPGSRLTISEFLKSDWMSCVEICS